MEVFHLRCQNNFPPTRRGPVLEVLPRRRGASCDTGEPALTRREAEEPIRASQAAAGTPETAALSVTDVLETLQSPRRSNRALRAAEVLVSAGRSRSSSEHNQKVRVVFYTTNQSQSVCDGDRGGQGGPSRVCSSSVGPARPGPALFGFLCLDKADWFALNPVMYAKLLS